jgi:hypothetical protein
MIAIAFNVLLISGTQSFMTTSDVPKRALGRAGIAWAIRRAADSGQRDAGRQWRNKLAGDVAKPLFRQTSDSGLRTARYATPIFGWTGKQANAITQPLCLVSDRDKCTAYAGEGALKRY